jgi:hypothetical protein
MIAGLCFFCWQKWQQKQEENLGYVQFNEFTKQEAGSDVYFENKESGLKFKVPAGWMASASQLASVALTTVDFKPFKDNPSAASVPATGCWIGISVKNSLSDDFDYAEVKKYLDYPELLIDMNAARDQYTIVNVGGKRMLQKNLLVDDNKGNVGNILDLELSQNNKLYFVETDLFGSDKERCTQFFNDFLNTISIK